MVCFTWTNNYIIGALCGAIYVDQEFIRLLITKFAEVHSLPWDKIEPEEDLMELMHTWHSRRDEFDGTGRNAEDWKVRVPDSLLQPDHNGARPKVVITAQDMATIFKLSVDRIKSMIGEQVSAIKEAQGKLPRVSVSRFEFFFLGMFLLMEWP